MMIGHSQWLSGMTPGVRDLSAGHFEHNIVTWVQMCDLTPADHMLHLLYGCLLAGISDVVSILEYQQFFFHQ